jgi:hypothetical protein
MSSIKMWAFLSSFHSYLCHTTHKCILCFVPVPVRVVVSGYRSGIRCTVRYLSYGTCAPISDSRYRYSTVKFSEYIVNTVLYRAVLIVLVFLYTTVVVALNKRVRVRVPVLVQVLEYSEYRFNEKVLTGVDDSWISIEVSSFNRNTSSLQVLTYYKLLENAKYYEYSCNAKFF